MMAILKKILVYLRLNESNDYIDFIHSLDV